MWLESMQPLLRNIVAYTSVRAKTGGATELGEQQRSSIANSSAESICDL
jgi:hypothetical protein